MITKHTPGPWTFWNGQTIENTELLKVPDGEDYKGWDSKNISIGNEKNEVLAEVKAFTTEYFLSDFNQWEANAKLIKAAPELLLALQNLVEAIANVDMKDCVYDEYKSAQTAIKKATE